MSIPGTYPASSYSCLLVILAGAASLPLVVYRAGINQQYR